ncbi:hypothetical protein [Sphingomonas sp.]|uniref:hypothetical protein n=1 Tax=Sphingomonas sp. TaxID=28214 RepID=UPI001B1F0139|nr:hypothetical protein [Sphingomonas sp.]MBO9714956.1 hypothetical protein [Sphingomonas sp.]
MRAKHRVSLALTTLFLLLPVAAEAQQNQTIVVEGSLNRKSDWWVAESDHVIVYSNGPRGDLTRITHNLERLHFLLSILLNRVDAPDETLKLRVTLVGDTAEFDAMDLRNTRSAQGPFAGPFQFQRYYDPREDGAVMAASRSDAVAEIERTQKVDIASLGVLQMNPQTGQLENSLFGSDNQTLSTTTGGDTVPISAEGRLYAGFAQHYLLTYFPAAYPRWYLDGFGELFSTIRIRQDGALEYGHMPEGYRHVIDVYGNVPVRDVLDGKYLEVAKRSRWTPYHAWILVHYLFFSDTRRAELSRYLWDIAHGASPAAAAQAFGDPAKLQAEVTAYDNRGLPYDRLSYPAERAAEPVLTQLSESQARFLKGRIEMGSRVEIPPLPAPGTDPKVAERMTALHDKSIEARDRWLAGLRDTVRRVYNNLDGQLLLTEAECRTGHYAECIAAADKALALRNDSAPALAWKGLAMAELAVAGPEAERPAKLRAARALIARANRADTEAVIPLIAYFRSFADAGEEPNQAANAGMLKAVDSVPAAPATRLTLGAELAREERGDAARKVLLPVAGAGYDSPEKPAAQAILEKLPPAK